jgi:hypothetical protein
MDFKADTSVNKKGVIMVFINDQDEYIYKYMPFQVTDYDEWMVDTFTNTTLTWFKNVYWKLEIYSCVLVKRQREWFQAAVPYFTSIWETIQEERQNGEFMKRAPKKRSIKNENENKNKNELKPEVIVDM